MMPKRHSTDSCGHAGTHRPAVRRGDSLSKAVEWLQVRSDASSAPAAGSACLQQVSQGFVTPKRSHSVAHRTPSTNASAHAARGGQAGKARHVACSEPHLP